MTKIRVLIVDDAVVVRSRVSKVLSTDPELEVVGVAANGRIALAKIPQLNPDVVILDVEMPEMDGLQTLDIIRQTYPHLSVIMFSTFTYAGATATLDALALGACDYATKPSNLGNVEAANEHIRTQLIPKIKLFGDGAAQAGITNITKPLTLRRTSTQRVEVVAIGVSTGGPNALAELLPAFGADFPVPILIVQHMPPMFTQLLAQRLAAKSQIPVREAVSGTVLEPGNAWIAPGDFHMVVERDGTRVRLQTNQEAPENSCRPAVDVLFRSVAQVYGGNTLAVILTGMGQDGLQGCEQIRELGGQIFVQDRDSSVVWGMPRCVANAGLADLILPLNQMAEAITRHIS